MQQRSTGDSEDSVDRWVREDPCFLSLAVSLHLDTHDEEDLPPRDIDLVNQHMAACRCWEKVLITSQNAVDPQKRRIYLDLYHWSLWSRMKRDGGDFKMDLRENGNIFRMTYPPYVGAPFTGGELFFSFNPSEPHQVIFDVRSQKLYDEWQPVLHYLDRTLVREVQEFNTPGGYPIQWWSILEEGDCTLWVRWQNQSKQIAEHWRLHPRYVGLIRWHDLKQSALQGRGGVADEAFKLRTLILEEYDDSLGGFAAFLDSRLPLRGIDEYRKREKDTMSHLADEVARDSHDEQSSDSHGILAELAEDGGDGSWRQSTDELIWRLDLPKLRRRLLAELDDQERKLLEMRLKRMTDEAIGAQLGVTRETVNRKFGRIREKASRLKT